MAADDRIAGVGSMFASTNKVKGSQTQDTSEGVVSAYLPELELSMTDEELSQQADDWEASWNSCKKELEFRQAETEKYWLGMNYRMPADPTKDKPQADNLIYEALETFLPKATQKSPDPVVTADNTPQGNQIAMTTEHMLAYLADNSEVNLRMTLRQVARFHQLYFLGVIKVGWSEKYQNVTCQAVRPQQLILDPDSSVINGNYTGNFIGQYRKDTASDLIRRFPDKKEEITAACQSKLGTKMQYIEWWANGKESAVFWTMKKLVLGKMRNPHWNYETQKPSADELGNPITVTIPPKNHFCEPPFPYAFLSVMNLGNRPFDETSGLYQCLTMQDVVTKRWKQIDRNADNTNNGLIASLDYFEEGQAAQAAQAMRNGDVMLQPRGKAGEGIIRDTGTPLPGFIYENLQDARARILSVYGVSGSNPSSLNKEQTVRGKMLNKSADDDRIGGGFTEYLEQMADRVFNLFVQFMYVYYDEPKMGSIVGKERAREYFQLQSSDFGDTKLTVAVREGSLIPKDSMTKRNEAIDLWAAQGIDPISFFEALEFPNPRESARMLFLWKSNPAALFPETAQPGMALGPQAPGATLMAPQGPPQASGGDQIPQNGAPLPLPPLPS